MIYTCKHHNIQKSLSESGDSVDICLDCGAAMQYVRLSHMGYTEVIPDKGWYLSDNGWDCFKEKEEEK